MFKNYKTALSLILTVSFLIISIIFFHQQTYAAEIRTNTQFDNAGKAYGYYLGQQYSLDRIKTKFPDLYQQVILAEANFNHAFLPSIKNIKNKRG